MVTRFFSARLLLCFGICVLAGCASFITELDPPRVTLDSFNTLPSASGAPRFGIKLRIQNPNRQALDIAGISYTVALLGEKVISGVSNDVPVIEGYGEGVVSLEASLQLIQLVRLLASLGQASGDTLEYRFYAKIDFNGMVPTQRIEETGKIALK